MNLKIIQTTDTTQQQKKKKNQQHKGKMGKRPEEIFLQERYTGDQQAHEKMLNITNYWRNVNQNFDEVPPHTDQNGQH